MSLRKHLFLLGITFLLSFIIQGVAVPELLLLKRWSQDQVMNLLHVWFLFVSCYYLFNGLLNFTFQRGMVNSPVKMITTLVLISFVVFGWFLLINALFYILYYNIYFRNFYKETTFYDFDLPMAIVIITLGALYFYQRYYSRPIGIEPSSKVSSIPVQKGRSELQLPVEEIGLFHLHGGMLRVYTFQGVHYLSNETLTSILDLLDDSVFFRLNRQAIVSPRAVRQITKLDFQKLSVSLIPEIGFEDSLTVSKYNAPAFRKWFNQFTP